MINIHFIINPIAGKGIKYLSKQIIESVFYEDKYALKIKYTTYKKHAPILTNDSIKEKASIIVACGGDGTINEVASCLVDSPIILGVVPMGSGNGLASNLNIPKKVKMALQVIKKKEVLKIDVGRINKNYFFSNTGIGFDATVIKNYESSNKRTLTGYIKACLTSFKEIKENKDLVLKINDKESITNPFLVFISNSNEMGYNFSLTPKASLQDGFLDVLIILKINKLKMIWFGFLMLINKTSLLKEATYYQTNKLEVQNTNQTYFDTQIDGEFAVIKNEKINISLKNKALYVIVPKDNNIF